MNPETDINPEDPDQEQVQQDDGDFELPAKACDLSGEGTCEACQ